MGKRLLLLVDSPLGEDYHYHLCMNFPDELLSGLSEVEKGDFESFERFYFSNKEKIELQLLIVDMVHVGFVTSLSSLFQPKTFEESSILSEVMDKIYDPAKKADYRMFLSNPSSDEIIACLDLIQKNLSVDEDMDHLTLMSKCVDLKNAVLQNQDLSQLGFRVNNEGVLDYCDNVLKELLKEWREKAEEYEEIAVRDVTDDSPWSSIIALLQSACVYIVSLFDQVIYADSDMSKDDWDRFMNLWLMIVSIDFKTVLPSSFYDRIKRVLE